MYGLSASNCTCSGGTCAYISSPDTESGGTIKVAYKRWAKLFVSILGSQPPLINGVRQPTRFASTPMGEIDPVRTEYIETTALGYDRDAKITVEEDLPISLEINGIFGGVTFDDT